MKFPCPIRQPLAATWVAQAVHSPVAGGMSENPKPILLVICPLVLTNLPLTLGKRTVSLPRRTFTWVATGPVSLGGSLGFQTTGRESAQQRVVQD